MSTPMSEIIVNHGMVEINDITLTQLLNSSPAMFFRRTWLLLLNGYTKFDRPTEIRKFLEVGMEKPTFTDYYWTSTQQSTTQETVVATGKTGYEFFSCALVIEDGAGKSAYSPYTLATCDLETGDVTFPIQFEAGLTYTIDFYKDGYFAQDLTDKQKEILGICMHAVWESRFENDMLNRQPKTRDRNNDMTSEAAITTAGTTRLNAVRANLTSVLRAYEQSCEYAMTVGNRQMKFV